MTRPLNFGVFITPFHPVGQSPTVALEYDLERTVALDRLGYDEVWFGEHHSGGYELIACPEVFIAAAAERTKHIRLGTGVVSLPYHHPLMVADRWVLLDHLTRGRVMFGTGPGALPSDAYMMGIDPVEQRRMMQESLEAILALFRAAPEERINRHSDWFTLRDAQLHIRPYTWPYPEISTAAMISPSGPRLAGRAGHVAAFAVDVGAGRLRRAGEHLGSRRRPGRRSPAATSRTATTGGCWPSCTSPTPATRRSTTAPTGCRTSRTTSARRVSCRCRIPLRALSRRASSSRSMRARAIAASAPRATRSPTSRTCSSSPAGSAPCCCSATTGRRLQATYHSYELFAREVMPHFKGQLIAPRASHDWAKGMRDQLLGRAGEAIVKAINEHTDELKMAPTGRQTKLMRASVLRDGRMVLRDDVPEPVPAPGQVLVGVKACGICGSDLHFAKHGADVLELEQPDRGLRRLRRHEDRPGPRHLHGSRVQRRGARGGPGHRSPGAGHARHVATGAAVATGVEPIVYSNNTIGGYAERMLLSAPLLTPIPNGLDARHAALTEPMAVGLHAVNKSAIQRGETALVLGCGPIGIAIIAGLRHRGVETIVAADFSAKRRELAETMGATTTVDPANGSPFDSTTPAVVFEAVGVPGIIDDVLRRAPVGARVVVAGVCMQPDTVHPFFAIAKQINVQFVFGLRPDRVHGLACARSPRARSTSRR